MPFEQTKVTTAITKPPILHHTREPRRISRHISLGQQHCLMSFCPRNAAGALEQVCFSTARTNNQEQRRGLTGITKHPALGSPRHPRAPTALAGGCGVCVRVTPLSWVLDWRLREVLGVRNSSIRPTKNLQTGLSPASAAGRVQRQNGLDSPLSKGASVLEMLGERCRITPWGSCCSYTRYLALYPAAPGGMLCSNHAAGH